MKAAVEEQLKEKIILTIIQSILMHIQPTSSSIFIIAAAKNRKEDGPTYTTAPKTDN